jgi:hypothetical protein
MKNTDVIDRIVSESTRELLLECEDALSHHAHLQERLVDLRLLLDTAIEQLRRSEPQPLY